MFIMLRGTFWVCCGGTRERNANFIKPWTQNTIHAWPYPGSDSKGHLSNQTINLCLRRQESLFSQALTLLGSHFYHSDSTRMNRIGDGYVCRTISGETLYSCCLAFWSKLPRLNSSWSIRARMDVNKQPEINSIMYLDTMQNMHLL